MLLSPTPHIHTSSGEPLDDILIDDSDKENYQNMLPEQRKQKWIKSFCGLYGGFRHTPQPIKLITWKQKRGGVANDIEQYIPAILAHRVASLNDIFETTPEEKKEIFQHLDIYIAHLTDEQVRQECAMILQFDDEYIRTAKEVIADLQNRKEWTQKEDSILNSRTEKQKQYISRGVIISYDRKNGDFASCQRFWNAEFLDEAKKGNLPIAWSEFVEIWSFLDNNLEQYIPGMIEYLHKNGYKKRLEEVFMLTPKEREYLTNMFTFGYQMQDTQTGILERVRKLLPFK